MEGSNKRKIENSILLSFNALFELIRYSETQNIKHFLIENLTFEEEEDKRKKKKVFKVLYRFASDQTDIVQYDIDDQNIENGLFQDFNHEFTMDDIDFILKVR